MKILHVVTSLRSGGVEKLLVDILPRFRSKGLDVELLVFDGIPTPFRTRLEASDVPIHDFGVGGSVYSPRRLFQLASFMRNYDIVHTHNTAPQLFAAIASLWTSRPRLITTEHNTNNRRRHTWYVPFDRFMYSRYERIICAGAMVEQNLRAFIGGSHPGITTIYNGIDIDQFASAEPSPLLEQLAPGSRKIVMVAGFRKAKDQPTLIRALQYLPDHFHLFLVGDGSLREGCRQLVSSILEGPGPDRVHFLGIRMDIPQLLQAADYVCLSSYFEGLPLSALEGMAVGRPFLGSNVDGLRELVSNVGVLFPCGDHQALAREILALEASPARYAQVARACATRATHYSLTQMVDAYAALYS